MPRQRYIRGRLVFQPHRRRLALYDLQDLPRQRLDLARALARVRLLVRVRLRPVRARRAERRHRRRSSRHGEFANEGYQFVGAANV